MGLSFRNFSKLGTLTWFSLRFFDWSPLRLLSSRYWAAQSAIVGSLVILSDETRASTSIILSLPLLVNLTCSRIVSGYSN